MNRKGKDKILISVEREHESIPFELAGGIIGVSVRTELIKGDESEGEKEVWEDEEEW
ncbi:MAG: hypothetical protein JW882_03475 [Deltaproteobacteria bacterium]|nr:hypothetical protein [Deltaproteobacteria bacterium]